MLDASISSTTAMNLPAAYFSQQDELLSRLTPDQRSAVQAAPERIEGYYLAEWRWAAQHVCAVWHLPVRYLQGVNPRHRFNSKINRRSVGTLNIFGLTELHQILLRRGRR